MTFPRLAMIVLLIARSAAAGAADDLVGAGSDGAAAVRRAAWNASCRRGTEWLLGRQADDGGWHSETYGSMQAGTGCTALVVLALAAAPTAEGGAESAAICRGVKFLTSRPADDGLVVAPDGTRDSPLYSAALTLLVLAESTDRDHEAVRVRLAEGLKAYQRTERNGWRRDETDFGGWGLSRSADRTGRFGPSNVSLTSVVLQALDRAGSLDLAVRDEALLFLDRCRNRSGDQRYDGGFVFTPRSDEPLNKEGDLVDANGNRFPRPYLAPSCDGWLARRACGEPVDSPESRATLAFIRREARDVPPFAGHGADRGLAFYTVAARSLVLTRADTSEADGEDGLWGEELIRRQRRDGSWSNPDPTMREDDPLIATAFAVLALRRGLSARGGEPE